MRYRASLIFSLLLFTYCNKDQANVTLQGIVYDQSTKQTIPGATVKIENAWYEGGDYDSYNNYEHYTLISDANGHFTLTLNKSAYIVARVFKAGYAQGIVAEEIFSNKPELIVYLKK